MLKNIRIDIIAGLTLAIIVLPQAIAFSTTLAGVPPEYGIYSAIWGVLFAALLNPSSSFLGGPNSTMAAVIGFTLLPLAPQFSDAYIGYMLVLIFIAALFQLIFYIIKPLSKIFDLIPESVTNGVITGIGCFLIYKSFAALAGLPINTQVHWPLIIAWHTFLSMLEIGNLYAIQIGLITFMFGILAQHVPILKVWSMLIALLAGTLYSEFLIFQYGNENILIEQVGRLSIDIISPSLPTFDRGSMPEIISLIPGAITLAFIGGFQTITAMRYVSRTQGEFHNVRDGLRADALSNCLLPFISALPSCGSYNRMSALQQMGSKTKVSAFVSVIALFSFSYFFIDVLKLIPIPALAAIIVLVGLNMIHWKTLTMHLHSKVETLSFLTSFMAIHIFGLFGAVIAGSIVSLLHFLWLRLHPKMRDKGDTIFMHDTMTYASLPELEKKIKEMRHTGVQCITLDTTKVTFVDNEAKRFIALFQEKGGKVIRTRDKNKNFKSRGKEV